DLFHWIGPVSDRHMYFFKLRDRTDIIVYTIDDVKKYEVGSVYKTAANDFLMKHNIKAQLVPRFNLNILKLLAGRIDLVLDADFAFKSRVKELNKDYLMFDKIFLADSSKKYYIVLNKNTDLQIVNALRNSFEKMKSKGLLKIIQKKYR
ncbi:MAG: ABC transporter substrate-binding protein, partial [Campylobacteraceae bacterium]|nr:ABC transporter substrate-binding protein [Campylobacteraceae bacterium]